jgi:hypothetical protein
MHVAQDEFTNLGCVEFLLEIATTQMMELTVC